MMRDGHVSNVAKSQLIAIMNSRFYNQEFYRDGKKSRYHLDYESNREIKETIFEDVLDFCVKTDVCKSLNMSLMDILQQCDMPTYVKIKEAVNKENERKAIILEKSQKETEKRQNQILGGMNGKRR